MGDLSSLLAYLFLASTYFLLSYLFSRSRGRHRQSGASL